MGLKAPSANPAATQQIAGTWTFVAMPEVHAASGDALPIYGRTSTDGKTVGAWNIVDDSIAGDFLHFTTGPNKASNANGCVIAIGVQYGGTGYFANNYGPSASGGHTIGFALTNLASNDDSGSYGFLGLQSSTVAGLVKLRAEVAGAKYLMRFESGVALNAGIHLTEWSANAVEFGFVDGNTGRLSWWKDIRTTAPSAGAAPRVGVADEVATYPSESYLKAKTSADVGAFFYKSTDGSTNSFWHGRIVLDSTNANYMKFKMPDGPVTQDAAGTLKTMFTLAGGVGSTGGIGFYGATPVAKQTITGSRGSNAALADLLTKLANMGVITDSTT